MPASTLGNHASFGFGDRIGLATPGHLQALREAGGGIGGIFAQQSIREMARTRRTADQVMAAAVESLAGQDYDRPWGADADHLKTPEDVEVTAQAGFVFFTIDPSDHVDQQADGYSEAQLDERYRAPAWIDQYRGQSVSIPGGPTIEFDFMSLKRATVKYGAAIHAAIELAEVIKSAAGQRGQDYEIEVSVDETDQPTTLIEHYVIADQLLKHGVKLVSLAPRFIGELEKGVDYIGDVAALEASLADHAAIARHLGDYKLSLHSGSDKLSMYAALARATQGRFHVKTAGTSYLEALRVVARHRPALFREIVDFSRRHYDTDKATYHVHATLADAPASEQIADDHELVGIYLGHWSQVPEGRGFTQPGRQVLHCTFGSVMTDARLGQEVVDVLKSHPETHRDILADHFARHLRALIDGWPALEQ